MQIKECRICGAKYEACRTKQPGVFNYREVACSRECGKLYLQLVEESRQPTKPIVVEPEEDFEDDIDLGDLEV